MPGVGNTNRLSAHQGKLNIVKKKVFINAISQGLLQHIRSGSGWGFCFAWVESE